MKTIKSVLIALVGVAGVAFMASCNNSKSSTAANADSTSVAADSTVKCDNFVFTTKTAVGNFKVNSGNFDFAKGKVFAKVSASIEWPEKIGNNDITALQNAVLKTAFGKANGTIDACLNNFVNNPVFDGQTYKVEKAENVPSPDAEGVMVLTNDVNGKVVAKSDLLVAFTFVTSSYTGGAHGMTGTTCLNYDVKANKVLGFNDVFVNGQDAKIVKAIKAVIAANKGKYAAVSADKATATHNFYLSKGTVTFVYLPYEIAPFSAGQIEVPVTVADIADALTPAAKALLK